MLRIFLTLVAIFIALVINEILWHKKIIKNEAARKTIHISVAAFVAFWPYYLSYSDILLISIAFMAVIYISRKLGLFRSIEQVKRNTLGEYFFPLGIFVLALFTPDKQIFTIALLCVGFADGLAALVGQRYGRSNRYKIFHGFKSIAGSSTVLIVSLAILILTNYFAKLHLPLISFLLMPLDVALVEAFAPYGSDDFLIPVSVMIVLNLL
jgi:dolichol kinase